VYVFKPKIDYIHGNGVAIIGSDGVFFVDTYIQTNYAEEAIRLLKKITPLPVKFVLNTHYHNDHVIGNYVFKKAFPGCQVIAHDSTYKFMISKIKKDIATEMKDNDDAIAQIQKELKDGKRTNGEVLTEGMKKFWKWELQEGLDYKKDYKGNQFVNADITFSDSLTFHWGSQTIKLIHAADKGHSSGDVIAWIPEKRIVITGDIIVAPTPYATYHNVRGMVKSIQKIIEMKPAIIIPGHGYVEYDLTYAQLAHDAFAGYIALAEEDAKNNVPLKEAMLKAALPDIDKKFYGDDDMKAWAYKAFFSYHFFPLIYKELGIKPTS
jgi:glyoxylase-like metal-dependent hydrolase (beta-lactamase superfamily II)